MCINNRYLLLYSYGSLFVEDITERPRYYIDLLGQVCNSINQGVPLKRLTVWADELDCDLNDLMALVGSSELLEGRSQNGYLVVDVKRGGGYSD